MGAKRYRVRAQAEFAAAHQLHGYVGGCERLHGHTFKVEVEVEVGVLDSIGMAVDFVALESGLREIVAPLDHQVLNEVGPFRERNPTAEHIGSWVGEQLLRRLPTWTGDRPARLLSVMVCENTRSAVVVDFEDRGA